MRIIYRSKRFFSSKWGTTIYAYPDEKFQVHFVEPFTVKIRESILTCDDEKCPPKFRELLDQIAASENGEVFVRELGF